MSQPPQPLSTRTASILHGALVVSALAIIGLVWVFRGGVPIALVPKARVILSYVAYGDAGVLLALTAAIRRRVSLLERDPDPEAWWRVNGPKILLLWILGEAGCVLGAVFWLLTDSQLVLLALAGVGLLVLAVHRPSKLLETN